MKLVICLPGNSFSGKWMDGFLNFYNWCLQNKITPLIARRESCNIYYVRNMCLGGDASAGEDQKPWQGKVDYDYMLWIDSDNVFEVDDFIKLYNMQKDIASGLYMMSDNIHYATVKDWDEEFFAKNGHFEFLTPSKLKQHKQPFKVDYTGFGFMLIKKGIFEKLKYPWFRPLWKNIGDAIDFTMEDVAFCHLVKEQGIDVWIHPEVVVKHEKKVLL
jgi:hypothetical protein